MGSEEQSENKQKEFNPRWKGYVSIMFSSLVCFASITNIPDRAPEWAYCVTVGIVTFALSFIILFLDRLQLCFDKFNYTKAMDGKFEGLTLAFFCLWWIVGCAIMTRASGLAYNATNIYFSSWLSFFSCLYTLDQWSGSKDILTMHQLTGLSSTLRSWYVLLLSSVVVLGSAADLLPMLSDSEEKGRAATFAIALGLISSLVSFIFIMVHYKFFDRIKHGGWLELGVSFIMIMFWVVGVGILTNDTGIASSIDGECYITSQAEGSNDDIKVDVNATTDELEIILNEVTICTPGSNLYFFGWVSLISSINIALRWKEAQAMQFAHAAQVKRRAENQNVTADDGDDDNDDDDSAI